MASRLILQSDSVDEIKDMEKYRILAYGGTSYSERMRVGRWPAIEPGVMGDRYAAREEPLSFGVGLIDGSPFVVLRQIQDARRRGGYPYTVLLDPGREAWEKVRWNGALLVKKLLADPEMAEIVLIRVESWTEQAMDDFVRRLVPVTETVSAALEFSVLHRLWAGMHLHRDRVVVSPDNDIFGGLPEVESLATSLADLPACFRLGRGWLIGGGIGQANAFGCDLVYDWDCGQKTSPLRSEIEDGLALLVAWKEIERSRDCGLAIEVLSATPAFEWPFPITRIVESVRAAGRPYTRLLGNSPAWTPPRQGSELSTRYGAILRKA